MPNYRRAHVPGGSFFFTVVVHRQRRLFDDPSAVALLRSVFRDCLERWPMTVTAIVYGAQGQRYQDQLVFRKH